MEIGKIIRKYRKKKEMTQEEMAAALGVTASAVNKWENGNSCPDIMMLATVARLLDITLDTLLSFQQNLSDQEIRNIIKELSYRLETEPYPEVFAWAKQKMETYPNCEQLIWQMAVVLDAGQLGKDLPGKEEWESYLMSCYQRVLNSENEQTRILAADALFAMCIRKEDYEKAEKYLSCYSDQNPEKKLRQAQLYSRTGRVEEAYRTYEELLFTGHNRLMLAFSAMFVLALEEKDLERARMVADRIELLERTFDMGRYNEICTRLDLVTMEQNVDQTVKLMTEMMDSVETLGSFTRSPLFTHMKFKELPEEYTQKMKKNLKACFCDTETYGYLKENAWWKKLAES